MKWFSHQTLNRPPLDLLQETTPGTWIDNREWFACTKIARGMLVLVLFIIVSRVIHFSDPAVDWSPNCDCLLIWSSIVIYYARQLNNVHDEMLYFPISNCLVATASWTWDCFLDLMLFVDWIGRLTSVFRSSNFVFCLAIEQFATISTDSRSRNVGVTVGWSMNFYHLYNSSAKLLLQKTYPNPLTYKIPLQ